MEYNWEYTVMGVNQMQEIAANMDDQGDHRYSHKEMRALLKKQAELSFKAGGKAQRDKQSVVETEAYFRGRNDVCTVSVSDIIQQGRREVVEFVEDTFNMGSEWQAQLKKWGI